ncbi:TPA: hypothetical protein ACP4PI_000070 [Escherichia coli]
MPSYKFNPQTGSMEIDQPISRITIDNAGIVKSEENVIDGVINQYFEYQNGGYVTVKKLDGKNEVSGHNVTVSFAEDEDQPGHVHATYKMRD